MGTCLGQCLHRSNSGSDNTHDTLVHDESIEFFDMADVLHALPEKKNKISTSIVTKLFTKLNKKHKKIKKKPKLELNDEVWSPFGETSYKRLNETDSVRSRLSTTNSVDDNISLQCLDARSLLTRATQHPILSSTPASSVDLEWEDEGLPTWPPEDLLNFDSSSTSSPSTPQMELKKIKTKTQQTTNLSGISGWSQISTPDSLEWDHVEAPIDAISDLGVSDLDAETEQLLSEIERLTKTALQETGLELR